MSALGASRSRLPWLFTAFSALAACHAERPALERPPDTRMAPVVDTIHGESFTDPYRWLEDQTAPDTKSWLEAQAAYAERILPRDELRRSLEQRLTGLMDRADIGAPRRGGDAEYFTLRRPGEEIAAIYRRPAPEPGRRVPITAGDSYDLVVDPRPLSVAGTTRVELMTVDRKGRYLVYAVRDGGQDEVELRIRDLASGQDLPEAFPAGLYSSVALTADGGGFYYSLRSRQSGARIRRHAWRSDVAADVEVFGEGYGPRSFVTVLASDDGRWLVFPVQHGWASTDVFALDLKAAHARPFAVVSGLEARFYPRFVKDALWMRTDLDAPNNRVVAVDLARPAQEHWRVVLPEQPDVLEDFVVIDGATFGSFLRDAASRLARFDAQGVLQAEVDVPPFHGASIRGDGKGHAVLTVESFATAETAWRLNLASDERELDRGPEIPWDGGDVEVRLGAATSKDGSTRVPVFVAHKRGLAPTGATPTLLFGYGGFYAGQRPSFSPLSAAWIEAGGVYALAILRGGSEFGEPWHRAGMLTNKQRVFDDFIAASEWLIAERYASPATLGIRGTSNGGLLVGAALTQRPELYRAVFCGFPDVDILRFNQFTTNNNMPALLEYGDAAIKAQFEAIKLYSPYQRVQPKTAYPAVMLASGDLDTRVPPLAARKFTARLQAASTSGRPVFLRYHAKAGHAAERGLPFSVRVQETAAELAFFMRELGLAPASRAKTTN